MIQHFLSYGKEWFQTLYHNREKRAPVFVKDQLWAGMSSTQRSESTNAYFDQNEHCF